MAWRTGVDGAALMGWRERLGASMPLGRLLALNGPIERATTDTAK
jgi:hypothetical protein